MPKKSKKSDKKKSKVKKIPAKAGAKARVSKDGKVEVILPVDRSRGKYKPRKTEEEKIKERLEQLRSQERRQFSSDVLAPERISGSYRTGGSINRSNVQAPVGGFTNLSTTAEQRENTRLQAVEKKLDKLLEKKEEPKKVEPAPQTSSPKPKPLIQEVKSRPLATRRRTTAQTPLTGQTLRPKESKSIVADIGSGVSALATAGVGLATAGVSGVLTTAEREIQAGTDRRRESEFKRIEAETERREKERKQKITDETQKRLRRVDENIAKEKRELERRQKALREEQNKRDKEEAFKLQEKIDREAKLVKQKEKEQARKDAKDIFSELETAQPLTKSRPQPEPEPVVEEIDSDDDFKSVEGFSEEETDSEDFETGADTDEEKAPTPPPRKVKPELPPRDEPPALPPRDDDIEQKRQQILKDQELARDLLRDEARNRDRKIKQAQERQNELDKLNRDFIAHKNREDRNQRRREKRQKEKQEEENKAIAKRVAGDIIDRQENIAEVEEEVEKIVLGGATAGLIEKAPVSVGRGRKVNINKLLDTGANRQQIEDYEDDLKRMKRLSDGIYSAFGINLTGSAGGLDYVKKTTSKDNRVRIRRDTIRKLRERGLLINQIQEFTRTLDQIDELIARRDKFGRDFQRRGGAVEQRAGRGRGRAGRPRGQRVQQQVADIEQNQQNQD